MLARIVHCIWPVSKTGPLSQRQALFLESVDRARKSGVTLVAVSNEWARPGWTVRPARRNASAVGDSPFKPFLKDLFDQALEFAAPHDWLFCGNVDCAVSADFYEDLASRRATVVEYMRQDVSGDPQTLEELFSFPREPYPIGLDGFAIRAGFYREIEPHFPDFVLGDPHWDTALSGILRNIVPVQRDSTKTFHPKHEQAWDLGNLTAAGKHNNQIYVDALTFAFCREQTIGPVPERTDTAVIVAVFGKSVERARSNKAGIERQLEQDLWADTYLVELCEPGAASVFPEGLLANVNHVRVDECVETAGLFQKEALLNIGWRRALERHPYEYFIFVDADVYCESPDWFRRIRAGLQENPAQAVQGFRKVLDREDPEFHWSSLAWAFQFQRDNDLFLNPGICWGLHRELLIAADGFNPYSLGSSGDSLFVAELLNKPESLYDPWLHQYRWFHDIYRDLPFRAEFSCVDAELLHEYHGPASLRNYDGIRYAIDGLGPVREWLYVNGAGLVAWKDPHGVERRLCERRDEMTDRAAVDRIFEELGLTREPRREAPPDFAPRAKAPFSIPGWRAPANIVSAAIPHTVHTVQRRFDLFGPAVLYRDDFPFSWCGNVRSSSQRIPTAMRDGVPRLVLEGLPGAEWVCAVLAADANWVADFRSCSRLVFTVLVPGDSRVELSTSLIVKLRDGRELDSPYVNLVERGLRLGERMTFEIPLDELRPREGGMDLVRAVRWSGPGSFSFELSNVYVV